MPRTRLRPAEVRGKNTMLDESSCHSVPGKMALQLEEATHRENGSSSQFQNSSLLRFKKPTQRRTLVANSTSIASTQKRNRRPCENYANLSHRSKICFAQFALWESMRTRGLFRMSRTTSLEADFALRDMACLLPRGKGSVRSRSQSLERKSFGECRSVLPDFCCK